MQVDFATGLSVCAFAFTVLTFIISNATLNGKHQALIASFDKRMNDLETERREAREKIEHDMEARFATLSALCNLMQSQMGDVRENIAANYMKKPEISDIEKRMESKHRDIIDTVRMINEKVDRLLQRNIQ